MLRAMIYAFGSMELDLAKVELRDNGELRSIEPQVFALIAYLAEHRDRMVSRDELFEKLWEGRVVSDSALASRIKSARWATTVEHKQSSKQYMARGFFSLPMSRCGMTGPSRHYRVSVQGQRKGPWRHRSILLPYHRSRSSPSARAVFAADK